MIDNSCRFGLGLCAVTLVTLMSACSGGGTAADTSPPVSNTPVDNTPTTVSGIATPSSVSVVTATNSN